MEDITNSPVFHHLKRCFASLGYSDYKLTDKDVRFTNGNRSYLMPLDKIDENSEYIMNLKPAAIN